MSGDNAGESDGWGGGRETGEGWLMRDYCREGAGWKRANEKRRFRRYRRFCESEKLDSPPERSARLRATVQRIYIQELTPTKT